jgi:hypothetical protein
MALVTPTSPTSPVRNELRMRQGRLIDNAYVDLFQRDVGPAVPS